MNKIILIFLFAILGSSPAFATHVTGASLRYEFNGTNYTFYLYINTQCPGITMPNTDVINLKSASASVNTNLTVTQVSSTVTPPCAAVVTTCQNPSALIPGFKVWLYTGTTTLAQANDWVISYTISARGASNNMNSTTSALYTEARLDNSVAVNTNPVVSGYLSYLVSTGTTNNIPLQAADAEGDNIDYELITPMASATTNVPYATGFSLPNTLGASGTCVINPTTKMLTVSAPLSGIYILAFKVKEYRNSVLIGSHIRDFLVMAQSGGSAVTYPVSTSSYNVYTCPGQVNSVTLNYTDAGGDSVFLTPTPPTMSGWSFSTSTTSAAGSGSVTINWTTPSSLNPATLPYFYIKINAADNSCPKAIMDYILVVRTQQCISDSVWPGDANGDKTVNIYDPLAIAIANGQTGAARTSPTTTWVAQACTPWANSFITNNMNMKHADCDGNGTVNLTDLGAVNANYGLTHPKGNFQHKATGAPPFYFDFTGITLTPGTTVAVPVKLGDATLNMTGLYGIATKIIVNGIVMTAPSLTTTTSWLGGTSNTLNFTKTSPSTVHWAHARTDHQEMNGYGTVGTLNFTVPANAKGGTPINFSFSMTKMIDKDGNDVLVNFDEQDITVIIPFIENVKEATTAGFTVTVVPNPSHAAANLEIKLAESGSLAIAVTDIVGKILWQQHFTGTEGRHTVSLPVNLPAGLYTVRVSDNNTKAGNVIKWVKD